MGSREELSEVDGQKSIIRIYCMRNKYIFNKRKNRRKKDTPLNLDSSSGKGGDSWSPPVPMMGCRRNQCQAGFRWKPMSSRFSLSCVFVIGMIDYVVYRLQCLL